MFDIGFTELMLIGVVALIVIGPERLPKVARTAGHLYGRMQRYVTDVKSDISREMEIDELKRAGQQFKDSMESTMSEVQQQASVVDDYLREETASIGKSVTSLGETEAAPPGAPSGQRTPAEPKSQQSLPLDEPDQNPVSPPATVVETARSDNAGNTA